MPEREDDYKSPDEIEEIETAEMAARFLATPREIRDEVFSMDPALLADDVEIFLNGGLGIAMDSSEEGLTSLDLEKEEARYIHDLLEGFSRQIDEIGDTTPEAFKNFAYEWLVALDETLGSSTNPRGMQLRGVIEGIDLSKIAGYTLTEFLFLDRELRNAPQEQRVMADEQLERLGLLARLSRQASSSESKERELQKSEGVDPLVRGFLARYIEGVGEYHSSEEDAKKLLSQFTEWKNEVGILSKKGGFQKRTEAATITKIRFDDIGVFIISEIERVCGVEYDDEDVEDRLRKMEDLARCDSAFETALKIIETI